MVMFHVVEYTDKVVNINTHFEKWTNNEVLY
ncbi:hypothetical protein Enr17x_05330 [Gimesia fumaroli]|uniref:Uncharacterized protein n=1 Tax=Gimesia fumaroli TaxID=2527976 RepID=A0A518I5Y0_9PLAN|nr:hypothetical protein Enr17x_05330 [Gimesia fumaroli]